MKQNIEEAKRRVFFYYHNFINKCLEDQRWTTVPGT